MDHERIAAELRRRMRGAVLTPGDPGYEDARRIWNAMIDRRPAMIARCTSTADVAAAVAAAGEADLPISVRGGGHNVAGTAVVDGGIMVDLSPMRAIRVDAVARRAVAQPGVLWGELDRATQEHELATTGGLVSTTGIAGFTLGGGLGWLMRQHGLACDNLRAAEVVLADGRVVRADAEEHADLFWGLRGGGGNFGIVTEFTHELYPLRGVLAGVVLHPWAAARDALAFFRDFAADAPDELTVHAGLLSTPDGDRFAGILACYAGDAAAGEAALRPLRAWGHPVADTIEPRAYPGWQAMFDEANAAGYRNYWKSSMLRRLEDGAIEAAVELFPRVPSRRSSFLIEGLGGAVARVPAAETAFAHRDAAFEFLISAIWDDPAEDEANLAWSREVFAALEPYARDSVYVNYLGNEGEARARLAYGPAHYARLVELKNRYDPGNLFRSNQNIRPTVDATAT